MRFFHSPYIFNGVDMSYYKIYINLESMHMLRRYGFQNGGLKSNRYESALL